MEARGNIISGEFITWGEDNLGPMRFAFSGLRIRMAARVQGCRICNATRVPKTPQDLHAHVAKHITDMCKGLGYWGIICVFCKFKADNTKKLMEHYQNRHLSNLACEASDAHMRNMEVIDFANSVKDDTNAQESEEEEETVQSSNEEKVAEDEFTKDEEASVVVVAAAAAPDPTGINETTTSTKDQQKQQQQHQQLSQTPSEKMSDSSSSNVLKAMIITNVTGRVPATITSSSGEEYKVIRMLDNPGQGQYQMTLQVVPLQPGETCEGYKFVQTGNWSKDQVVSPSGDKLPPHLTEIQRQIITNRQKLQEEAIKEPLRTTR